MRPFPSDFLWGATLSAHAVEGGHFASDWWRWEQRPGRIADGSTSQAGSNHWDRYQDDIGLARKFGLNALLVSLEWSRIEPEQGTYGAEVLEHYRSVLQTMRDAGIEPIVALQEVTLPEWFALKGGWLRSDSPEVFSRYVAEVARAIGQECRYWVPIMDPVTSLRMGYLGGPWPPGKRSLRSAGKALRNMARGHAAAYRAFRDIAPEAQLGASLLAERVSPFDETRPWDLRASRWEQALSNRVWPDALIRGRWPRPFGEEPGLADTVDFVGVSYYGARKVRFRPGKGQFAVTVDPEGRRAASHIHDQDPDGMLEVLNEVSAFGKPLMVLGNGIATEDDGARCHYLLDHLAAVHRAVEGGLDVRGYFYRSLLDGFEWDRGYGARYGLVHVGRETLARTPNTSAYLYKDIATAGAIRKGALARYCPDWAPPEGFEVS